LLDGRDTLYREVADLVVDTSLGGAEAHAAQIRSALERPVASG